MSKISFEYFDLACNSNGTLITFDDLPSGVLPIPSCYNNIDWRNGYYHNGNYYGSLSDYNTVTVSGNYSLFNWFANPLRMTSMNGKLFTLNSAVLAAAWNDNLILTITGYRSQNIIQNRNFTLQVFTASYLNFSGYSGLDQLVFTSYGGARNSIVVRNGFHFAMDNVCLTFT